MPRHMPRPKTSPSKPKVKTIAKTIAKPKSKPKVKWAKPKERRPRRHQGTCGVTRSTLAGGLPPVSESM
jgi:hypothetical protein